MWSWSGIRATWCPKRLRRQSGESYRLDRDECHGIKELVVLLTHLYDHGNDYLIIDEPELNLHPQYQAFFMQEVRKVAGSAAESSKQKIVFLITHSPFILELRYAHDIKSLISFDLDYSVPKQVARVAPHLPCEEFVTGRLNSHGKQLFFSDNPIFVEGSLDATMMEALMEARGVSVAAAGSCIIDCGGVEEVNDYLTLCQGLGKKAHFVYDLDSVFEGRLRSRVKDDDSVRDLLAAAGVGLDFSKYVGEMCQFLNALIDLLPDKSLDGHLDGLRRLFKKLGQNRKEWGKRTACEGVDRDDDCNQLAQGHNRFESAGSNCPDHRRALAEDSGAPRGEEHPRPPWRGNRTVPPVLFR